MTPIPVARVTVVEVDTGIAIVGIVAVVAIVPVATIVCRLNNGVVDGSCRTDAWWGCLGGKRRRA
jgi:hypothetical protein